MAKADASQAARQAHRLPKVRHDGCGGVWGADCGRCVCGGVGGAGSRCMTRELVFLGSRLEINFPSQTLAPEEWVHQRGDHPLGCIVGNRGSSETKGRKQRVGKSTSLWDHLVIICSLLPSSCLASQCDSLVSPRSAGAPRKRWSSSPRCRRCPRLTATMGAWCSTAASRASTECPQSACGSWPSRLVVRHKCGRCE